MKPRHHITLIFEELSNRHKTTWRFQTGTSKYTKTLLSNIGPITLTDTATSRGHSLSIFNSSLANPTLIVTLDEFGFINWGKNGEEKLEEIAAGLTLPKKHQASNLTASTP